MKNEQESRSFKRKKRKEEDDNRKKISHKMYIYMEAIGAVEDMAIAIVLLFKKLDAFCDMPEGYKYKL